MRKLFLFVLSISTSFYSYSQSWSMEDYQNHTWESFFNSEIASQVLDPRDIDYPLLHAAIFYATNQHRAQNRLRPLEYSPKIEILAADHAHDMAKHGFFSHQSKIRNKRKLRDRFQIVGLNPSLIAENISNTAGLDYEYGRKVDPPQQSGEFTYTGNAEKIRVPFHTYLSYAQEIVRLWMESPGHRANILNPDFKYLGCGTQLYGEKSFYNMPYFMNVQCFSD